MRLAELLSDLHTPDRTNLPFNYNSGETAFVSGTTVSLPSFTTIDRRLRLAFIEFAFGGAVGLDFRFTLDNVPGWASIFYYSRLPVVGFPIFALVEPRTVVTPIVTPDYNGATNYIRLGGWYL